ncbi:hypothetical protein HDU91_002890 [Kappamyces sp. JEL0680]|nr:hypothetical protein HDU91_002890 [Kappamyces sp. JEL0680]
MRAWKFNVTNPLDAKLVAIYGFKNSDPKSYPSLIGGKAAKAADIKLGAAQVLKDDILLVIERVDDAGTRLLALNFTTATNLIGTKFENSLDFENVKSDLSSISLADRTIVFDSYDLPIDTARPLTVKLEGVAVLAPASVLLITDNDFGLGNVTTNLFTVGLKKELPGVAPYVAGTCTFPYSTADASYFVLSGPASRSVLSAGCELRGASLVGVDVQLNSDNIADFVSKKLDAETGAGLCKTIRAPECPAAPVVSSSSLSSPATSVSVSTASSASASLSATATEVAQSLTTPLYSSVPASTETTLYGSVVSSSTPCPAPAPQTTAAAQPGLPNSIYSSAPATAFSKALLLLVALAIGY